MHAAVFALAIVGGVNACVLCERRGSGAAAGRQLKGWQQRRQTDPLASFAPPHFGEKIVNATLFTIDAFSNVSACADRCLDAAACIAFTWQPAGPSAESTCVGSGWSSRYATDTAGPTAAYYSRIRRSNTSNVRPAMDFSLSVPIAGVELHAGPLAEAFAANVQRN
jgi:hypothetical protein